MKKGCPESILKEQGKKACYLLREDGPVIEVGENDTLIINKLVGEPEYFGIFGLVIMIIQKIKFKHIQLKVLKYLYHQYKMISYLISRPLYFLCKKSTHRVITGIDEYVKEFTSKRASGKGLSKRPLVPLPNPKEAISKSRIKQVGINSGMLNEHITRYHDRINLNIDVERLGKAYLDFKYHLGFRTDDKKKFDFNVYLCK